MLPLFSAPLALLGLLGVPALAGIYWLRSRSRPVVVSSLLLWLDERENRGGGRRVRRSPLPPSFFLESFILILLTLAAAGPKFLIGSNAQPLVIVLDNSFSMLAGGQAGARARALRAVEGETATSGYRAVRFVLAGASPQLADSESWKSSWNCGAPVANLEEAVAFAFGLESNKCRVLVVTDHAPPPALAERLKSSPLQWRAYGVPQPNFAFVNAGRAVSRNPAESGVDRCLIEIANLSPEAGATTLTVRAGKGAPPQVSSLSLAPHETRRLTFSLPNADGAAFEAALGNDALTADNAVTLLPTASRPVRVAVSVQNEPLRTLTEKALAANDGPDGARLDAANPDLVITDAPDAAPRHPGQWTLALLTEPTATSYVGPFVLNRAHPLTDGLSLTGVIWSGGDAPLPGTPVVLAGNTPLLTDVERADGGHDLRLRLRADLSTLPGTPNWPILMANLISWRNASTSGARPTNARLGGGVTVVLSPETKEATVVPPIGRTRATAVQDAKLVVASDAVGVFEVRTENETHRFAANALAPDESDLTQCAGGDWGEWSQSPELEREYRNVSWAFLLAALGALALHAALLRKGADGGARAVPKT
jgi:hypothetical protein